MGIEQKFKTSKELTLSAMRQYRTEMRRVHTLEKQGMYTHGIEHVERAYNNAIIVYD